MAQYDLSSRIGSCLDRHLVFPILEFLSERGVSMQSLILNAKTKIHKTSTIINNIKLKGRVRDFICKGFYYARQTVIGLKEMT